MKTLFRFAIVLAATPLFAQPGTLDPTFGIGGKAIATVPGNYSSGECIAEQADGRIIVGGATPGFALLARFNTDGTLDNSFGNNGLVLTDVDQSNDFVGAVAVQPDGKIVAGGVRFNNTSDGQAIVMRHLPNGSLDNSFGTNGIRTLSISGALDSFVKAIALQPDGRIAVFGEYWTGSVWESYAMRLNSDGSTDSGFGTVQLDVSAPGGSDTSTDMTLQSDGKLLLCGSVESPAGGGMYLVRLNANGSFDSSFGTGGKKVFDIGAGGSDKAYSVRVQADGRILLCGVVDASDGYRIGVARLLADGNLDVSFATTGTALFNLGVDDWATPSLTLQPDGKIIMATANNTSNAPRVKVVRMLPDGSLDAAFGTNGIGTSNATSGNNDETAVRSHFLSDGGIAVAGFVDTPNNIQVAVWKFRSGVNVGLDETNTDHALMIAPNPVHDRITLRSEMALDLQAPITVRDLTGKTIEMEAIRSAHSITLDAAHLPSGPYFVTVQTKAGLMRARFIKN